MFIGWIEKARHYSGPVNVTNGPGGNNLFATHARVPRLCAHATRVALAAPAIPKHHGGPNHVHSEAGRSVGKSRVGKGDTHARKRNRPSGCLW